MKILNKSKKCPQIFRVSTLSDLFPPENGVQGLILALVALPRLKFASLTHPAGQNTYTRYVN
jgi:hypothetical protein